MKKIFFLFSVALISASAWVACNDSDDPVTPVTPVDPDPSGPTATSNVVFTLSEDSTTYDDGQTMVIYSNDFDGDVYFDAPMLLNIGEEDAKISLTYTITHMPAGTRVADCLSGSCMFRSEPGTYTTDSVLVEVGKKVPTMIEWNCYDAENVALVDSCVISFDINIGGEKIKTIVVKFVNDIDTEAGKAKTLLMGYSIKDLEDAVSGSLYNYAGKDTVIAGTVIPASEFKSLTDGKITGMRFALACPATVTNAYVYKIGSQSISMLACFPIEGGVAVEGWNTVKFPTSVDLPTDGDLMLAFTYKEVSGKYPLMINPDITVEEGFLAYFSYQGQRAFYDLSGDGALLIQAYVESCMYPRYDTKMSNLILSSKALQAGQKVEASFGAKNFGYGTVSSYKFDVMVNNEVVASVTEECGVELTNEEAMIPVEFIVPSSLDRGSYVVSVKAAEVNGRALTEGTEDDLISANVSVFMAEDIVSRQRHLIEEFTSHSCTYCPNGAAVIDLMMEQHPGEIALVCLHGNQSSKDPYNTTEVNNMLSYLNCAGFPTGALNRIYQVSENGIAAGLGYGTASVGAPIVYDQLTSSAEPSFASVDIATSVEENTLKITVSGKGGSVAKSLLAGYSLTAYVLESGLVNRQLKNGTWINQYTHNHVVRKIATNIVGDDINWISDTEYSNELQAVTLDASWVKENMSVVAFLSKKQPASNPDYTDMAVNNANEVSLSGSASSVAPLRMWAPVETLDKKVVCKKQMFKVGAARFLK